MANEPITSMSLVASGSAVDVPVAISGVGSNYRAILTGSGTDLAVASGGFVEVVTHGGGQPIGGPVAVSSGSGALTSALSTLVVGGGLAATASGGLVTLSATGSSGGGSLAISAGGSALTPDATALVIGAGLTATLNSSGGSVVSLTASAGVTVLSNGSAVGSSGAINALNFTSGATVSLHSGSTSEVDITVSGGGGGGSGPTLIGSVAVSSPVSSAVISSIPQTYGSLQLVVEAWPSDGSDTNVCVTFNGEGGNGYAWVFTGQYGANNNLNENGSGASRIELGNAAANTTANGTDHGYYILNINHYTGNEISRLMFWSGTQVDNGGAHWYTGGGVKRGTSVTDNFAITSIEVFLANGSNLAANTNISLFGIPNT